MCLYLQFILITGVVQPSQYASMHDLVHLVSRRLPEDPYNPAQIVNMRFSLSCQIKDAYFVGKQHWGSPILGKSDRKEKNPSTTLGLFIIDTSTKIDVSQATSSSQDLIPVCKTPHSDSTCHLQRPTRIPSNGFPRMLISDAPALLQQLSQKSA